MAWKTPGRAALAADRNRVLAPGPAVPHARLLAGAGGADRTIHYTCVIFSALLAWWLWGESLDRWSALGIALVVATCVMVGWTRRSLSSRSKSALRLYQSSPERPAAA